MLTLFVVGSGVAYLADHPQLVERWWADVWAGQLEAGRGAATAWPAGAAARGVRAAVPAASRSGLSGFELTLMAMPLVRGRPDDNPEKPRGTIRNTRILLVVAAVTMSA